MNRGEQQELSRVQSTTELPATLRQLMQERSDRDIAIHFSPGVHDLSETLILKQEHLPRRGFRCSLASADPQQPAHLRGSVAVRGWLPERDSPLWSAPLPEQLDRPRALYADGKRMPNARSRVFLPQTLEGKDPFRVCQVPEDLSSRLLEAENLTLSLLPKQKWIHNRIPLIVGDAERGELKLAAPATYELQAIGYGWFPEGHAWIENHPLEIREPGQWAIDYRKRRVFWWPCAGMDPEEVLRLPLVTEMLRIEGDVEQEGPVDHCVERVHVENLHFTENDAYLWPEGHEGWGIQHDWEMWDAPSAALRFRGSSHCRVEGCHFTQLASTAIRLDLTCMYHEILNNQIHHVGVVGILAAGYGPGTKDTNHHHRIEGNEISYVGEQLWHGVGIFLWQSGHNLIRKNRIRHCPYSGLLISGRISYRRDGRGQCSRTIRWSEIDVEEAAEKNWMSWFARERYQHARENRIEENEISRVMEMLGDGNAIYLSGAGRGNRLFRNILHDNDSLTMNAVIRADDDQHECYIEENLILRSVGEGILIKGICELRGNQIVDLRAADSSGRLSDYLRGYVVCTSGASNGSVVMDTRCYTTQDRSPFLTLGGGKGKYGAASEALMSMKGNRSEPLQPVHLEALAESWGREKIFQPPEPTEHGSCWPRIRIKEQESWVRPDE